MGLFSSKPTANAQKIIDFLGCECEYFPAGKPLQLIRSAYEDAYARMEMGGYTPVIVVADDLHTDWIESIYDRILHGESPEVFRQRLLKEDVPDAGKWFTERLNNLKEESGEYWEQITSENGEIGIRLDRLNGFVNSSTNKSEELILAKIPTDKPWEIFAWLPFGGWNECPDYSVMIAVAKYWYGKYHAVPAVMTHDVLEFTAFPVKDRSAAIGLALEQYAFCTDIVDQGVQTIEVLADSLTKSSVWSFWWD